MINRRNLLVAAAAVLCTTGTAGAADWKSQYPELTFAVVPAENASGVSDRFAPFVDYLSKELGVPVKLRIANDYAAVIEGQRAGNIQIAYYGPASYSTAYLTGVKGKTIGFVDPNSTSGYNAPVFISTRPASTSTASSASRSSPAATRTRSSRWQRGRSIAPPTGGTPTTIRT
jgi:phosphonate transport system substrate-binding protein